MLDGNKTDRSPTNASGPRAGTWRPRSGIPDLGLADYVRRIVLAVLILALAFLVWRGAYFLFFPFSGSPLATFLFALGEGPSLGARPVVCGGMRSVPSP